MQVWYFLSLMLKQHLFLVRDLPQRAKKIPNPALLPSAKKPHLCEAPSPWQKPLGTYRPTKPTRKYHNRGPKQESPNAAPTLQFPMPRLTRKHGDRTHPLIWLAAIVLAFLAVAVIITGVAVFVVYMIYKPKMPYLQVAYAHLDKLDYDQSGLLDTQMTLAIVAENDNAKADASFNDIKFALGFQDIKLAELRADPFNVPRNSTLPLNYIVPSSPIPLDEEAMDSMDAALKMDRVPFMLYGHARTRWRVGIFFSVKFWTHLSCQLEFTWSNGSSIGLDCNSKSL